MPASRLNLIGHQYGRLMVVADVPRVGPGNSYVICRCACGEERRVRIDHLRRGDTISCRCFTRERVLEMNRTKPSRLLHGLSNTTEYRIWAGIKTRCYNRKSTVYSYYGGRGIMMCDRWLDSFEAFLADMGPRPSPRHSIERNDNDGHYEPTNCRWATKSEQNRNRRHLSR